MRMSKVYERCIYSGIPSSRTLDFRQKPRLLEPKVFSLGFQFHCNFTPYELRIFVSLRSSRNSKLYLSDIYAVTTKKLSTNSSPAQSSLFLFPSREMKARKYLSKHLPVALLTLTFESAFEKRNYNSPREVPSLS